MYDLPVYKEREKIEEMPFEAELTGAEFATSRLHTYCKTKREGGYNLFILNLLETLTRAL